MKTKTLPMLVWGMLLAALATSPAQTTFTKITTGQVVTDGADGEGCAWVDFDDDGDLDLYVSCDQTSTKLLYRNDGNGVFTKITTGAIVTSGGRSISACWADVNNDGRIDLFTSRQNNSPGLLFLQQDDGSFTQSTLPLGGFSWGAAWGDYDNDGFVDLLVGDQTQSILWQNDGQGGFAAVTNTPIVTTPDGLQIAWTDYDNDGDLDAFVTHDQSDSILYRNDGAGVFTPITTGPLAGQSAHATVAVWGDFDNDGFLDLFLVRLDTSFQQALPSFLFRNNGDGTLTKVEQSPFTDDTGFSASGACGDYDNDGWLDLIVTDFAGHKNRIYHNKGDGTFERVLAGSVVNDVGNSASVAWGDYDRDGFLDLFVANGSNGANNRNDFLYHNDGNSNAWITVKCIGTRSNRSAIGAKVRVKATIGGKTFWQLREINTGTGFSQNALEAHFGLGNATNVETLRIEWPSGTVQESQIVAAKQYLTVTEPSRLLVSTTTGNPQLVLQGGRNLQYDVQWSPNLTAWSPLSTITITNFDGTASITDTNAPSSGARFYRAVLR